MGFARTIAKLIGRIPMASSAARAVASRGALVFMLHRVLPSGTRSYDAGMVISTDVFASLVEWLSRNFELVPLSEVAEAHAGRRKLRGLCALTFDDGWLDNHEHALPILKRYHAPATVFLASGLIGGRQRLWQERLWYCLEQVSAAELESFRRGWRERGGAWESCPAETNYRSWRKFLLQFSSQQAKSFVDALQQIAPTGTVPDTRTFLNWDEVCEMRSHGVEIGAHTVHHVLLTAASPDVAWNEISGSRREVEERLGTPITGFAYPWGAVNPAVRDAVHRAGFSHAVGVQAGVVNPRSDSLILPRIFVADSVLCEDNSTFSDSAFGIYMAARSLARGTDRSKY